MDEIFRLSTYSYAFMHEGIRYLFSSRSRALVCVSDRLWNILERKTFRKEEISGIGILEDLVKCSILSTEYSDNVFYNKFKAEYLSKAFQTSHLSLTVLPTESCNLACPYCFEGDKHSRNMSVEIQDAIVKYVKNKPIKSYSLTWFGGEPLLRPDVIESLLDKLSDLDDDIPLTQHVLITNGTLLNKRSMEIFSKFPLDEVQITIDGPESIHNSKRHYKNGIGTYEDIRKNIIEFSKLSPATHISIRINIDKNNQYEFERLYKEISGWFSYNSKLKYNIYPGIIKEVKSVQCNSFCLNKREQLEFYLRLNKKGIRYYGFPQKKLGGCIATYVNSAVIGADGSIYRCWEDVGDAKRVVGHVLNRHFSNPDIFSEYLINGPILFDQKCVACNMLPICGGGCAKNRLMMKKKGDTQESCSLYKIQEGILLKDIIKEYNIGR